MDDYSVRLHRQLHELRSLAERVLKGDPDARGESHALAHRIHGTAGVMGFRRESRIAREVERQTGADGCDHAVLDELVRSFDWDRRPELESPQQRAIDVCGRPVLATSPTPVPRILLLEDDDDFVAELAKTARRNMVELLHATDVESALGRARAEPLLGILVDYYIHDRLGVDIVLELRELPEFQGVPFAFVSVDSSLSTRVACAHAGGMFFLEKPVRDNDFGSLVHRFAAALARQRSRILLVDDDPDLCREVAAWLSAEGWITEIETDSRALLERCEAFRPDLVILDFDMPHVSGLECCRLIRMSARWANLPLLFLTAMIDPETQAACFEAGADDFVDKPIVRQKLAARVRNRLERQELLKREAERDPLTGLYNRSAFVQRFDVRMAEARRANAPMALCLLDMDNFKQINARHGHLAGDDVLRTFGHKLRARFRLEDVRCRWGGEEFVVLFVGDTASHAAKLLQRFLDEFARLGFRTDGSEFGATFSAGLAEFPRDGQSLRALMAEADCRLHAAKSRGKRQVVADSVLRDRSGLRPEPALDVLLLAADPDEAGRSLSDLRGVALAPLDGRVDDLVARRRPACILVDKALDLDLEAARLRFGRLAPDASILVWTPEGTSLRDLVAAQQELVMLRRQLRTARVEVANHTATLHGLAAHMSDGLLTVGPDGIIQTVTAVARAMLAPNSIQGRQFSSVFGSTPLSDLIDRDDLTLVVGGDGREFSARVLPLVSGGGGYQVLLHPPGAEQPS